MSMQGYMKAVTTFLQGFGMKVYAEGMAPEGTGFPHMTVQAAYAPFTQTAGIKVTIWHREPGGYALCLQDADRVWAAIPEEGRLLKYHKGMALLCRAGGSSVSLVKDREDPDITGAVIRLRVKIYDMD